MKPGEFTKILDEQNKVIERAREVISEARNEANRCPLPARLRPATARDIVVGAIIWYPEWENHKWCIVDEVLYPNDSWKAFCADDGCRYGLDGAFVEEPCDSVHYIAKHGILKHGSHDGKVTLCDVDIGENWELIPNDSNEMPTCLSCREVMSIVAGVLRRTS